MLQNSKYVQKSMNTTQRPKSLHRRFFMNFVHGRPFMKKKYHNFSDEWIQQMGQVGQVQYSDPLQSRKKNDVLGLTISGEETDPQASSAITNCEPEHGNLWKHVETMWVLGLGMRSVSSKLYAKEHLLRSWQVTTTFSMRSVSQLKGVDYQDGCVRVRRLNSLIDFPVSLCSWSERLFFSSPFTIVRIEYCACCHEYLRVLSVTQCPATLPCSSAVRGQPGQGASLLCESGFS